MSVDHIDDAGLIERINEIIRTVQDDGVPDPIKTKSPYGYDVHQCSVCGKNCLIRSGGYLKHYAKMHNPLIHTQKAIAIIKAVRKHDRKH